MKQMKWLVSIFAVLALAACNNSSDDPSEHGSANDGEQTNQFGTIEHGVNEGGSAQPEGTPNEDEGIGFNLAGGEVEEAQNVPEDVKEAVKKQFATYLATINNKQVDEHVALLSPNSESFTIEGEREHMTELFEQFDMNYEASDETIVKYDEEKNEVQLYATMAVSVKEIPNGKPIERTGRQVTVFHLEDGEWKIVTVHFIGDQ